MASVAGRTSDRDISSTGQSRDPLRRGGHASGDLFYLGTTDGLVEGAGDETHDGNFPVKKHRDRNGADFIARPGVDAVEMVVFVTQVVLVFVGGVLQFSQAPGIVYTPQLFSQYCFCPCLEADLVTSRPDGNERYPQLFVELLVESAPGLMGPGQSCLEVLGVGKGRETRSDGRRVG